MYNEKEVNEDLDKLQEFVDELYAKYGKKFSCTVTVGVDIGDNWVGSTNITGEQYLVHQACHALLKSPKFIDAFFDAVAYNMLNIGKDKPVFLRKIMMESIESMKKVLIQETEAFKEAKAEKEAEDAVNKLLKETGFAS